MSYKQLLYLSLLCASQMSHSSFLGCLRRPPSGIVEEAEPQQVRGCCERVTGRLRNAGQCLTQHVQQLRSQDPSAWFYSRIAIPIDVTWQKCLKRLYRK